MYFLRLSKPLNVETAHDVYALTDAIGPFASSEAAHAWFLHNFRRLDKKGVLEVTTNFMAMPMGDL